MNQIKILWVDDAIDKAAELANVKGYTLVYYPQQKKFFEKLFYKEDDSEAVMKAKLGELYFIYHDLNNVMKQEGVQARIPANITIQ